MIKSNKDLFRHFIFHKFNNSFFSSNFSLKLKSSRYSAKDKLDVENYRPISTLPTLSKFYERCMHDKMYKYFDQSLSKYQSGFCQGYHTQDCLHVVA